MVYLWFIYGLSMVIIMVYHNGLSMVYLWFFYGYHNGLSMVNNG